MKMKKSKNMLIAILLIVFVLVIIVYFSILGGFHDRKTVTFSTKPQAAEYIAVSYTHLTLPTKLEV